MTALTIEVPIKTVSEANRSRHEHWGSTARRVKQQRNATRLLVRAALNNINEPETWLPQPVAVTLIRFGPKKLDDDNLGTALKAVQDGVADALGIDDGDVDQIWFYHDQVYGESEYKVVIKIDLGESKVRDE